MNRRKLLKSLTLLPLAGAAVITPGEANAQNKKKNQWTPKKQVVRKSNSGGNTNTSVPTPLGPAAVLSGCVRSGHLLFVSGIGGWYPERRPEAGDIKVQIKSILDTLKEVLDGAGSSMANALKVHMTVVEPNKNIAALNEAYRGYFPDPAPVRSYTGTSADLMGREGVLVQLDCIAYVD
ncbi:RidA family protein [Daejeonella sp.]|uniref:RidA family protein n=1 Tax=Daejeonella sp. TaxID=2805397 RepID=UPI0030BE36FC